MASLPDDLLHMICGSLWEQRDFDTLYHCACAGKQLAVPALASLYRMHDVAPVTTGSDEVDTIPVQGKSKPTYESTVKGQERVTMKWANMWRSIMLSSLGLTLFPYAQYIRTLDFQDLQELFDDSKFSAKLSNIFFGGKLQKYKVEVAIPGPSGRGKIRLDINATVNNFAEVITQHTPMLEALSGGPLNRVVLAKCLPHIPKLQRLTVFSGEALDGNGDLIRQHCPLFAILTFYSWRDDSADEKFAAFLNALRPQSLQSFETFSTSQIGAESFSAFNQHSSSLLELHLNSLKPDAMPALCKLRECTNLSSFLLAETAPTQDLENLHNDCFLETVAWLRDCKKLHTISINKFLSAAALLTPILSENGIQLKRLDLEGYSMLEAKDFHQVLALQPSLQYLSLKGESSERPSDVETLVDSLSKLTNLTELSLLEISNAFFDTHICTLAQHLPKLEILWISGTAISDAIWPDMSSLRSLRQLELSADTRFTANGIMDFVLNLGPGNKGFSLNVMMQEMTSDLSETEHSLIRDTLRARVDGRFDFQLIRDPEQEVDFSDSDSD